MHIERVDNLPVILNWLLKMRVQALIDRIWSAHGNWQGLSLGQLAVLFIAYVIQRRTHTLSKMETWVVEHRTVLEQVTGWRIGEKEATDDRLGILLDHLGRDEVAAANLQRQLSQQQIQAFALPTQVARYDTTSFSVHHAPAERDAAPHQLLRFGHSKDHRPDLLQFKQGLGTLDPAGVPIYTQTLAGQVADDSLYIGAWREMATTIGHTAFLFVADCKAASQETRATLDQEGGRYLFPLPMTGETPAWLQQQVQRHTAQPIVLPKVLDQEGRPKRYGCGFVLERQQTVGPVESPQHQWTEHCFVTRSDNHSRRQLQALEQRLARTDDHLQRLRPKGDETSATFRQRAQQVLAQHQTTDYFTVQVQEGVIETKHYLKRGRPGPDTPYEMVRRTQLSLTYQRESEAIATARQMAGWRVFVSNAPASELPLSDAIAYYRDEWQVEHGMHRFKHGNLPVLPLAMRLPDRIRGLMLLLFIALQALTCLEFVARRSLAQQQQTLSGLIPGNPGRRTDRPTAERLLAAFDHLHLIAEEQGPAPRRYLAETLSNLQLKILELLDLSPAIYEFGKVRVPL